MTLLAASACRFAALEAQFFPVSALESIGLCTDIGTGRWMGTNFPATKGASVSNARYTVGTSFAAVNPVR